MPAGGVLIANAYWQFLAAPALACLCEPLAAVPAMRCTDAEVIDRLDRLRSTLAEREFSDEVRQAVAAWLAEHRLNETPLAVRSSATAEDSATASFAGIHRSCLNCVGLEEVLDGIRACYASLWTPAALAYRRHQNLSDAEVACAVVLCAMIGPARAGLNQISGVAFSCDPRTGWRDRIQLGAVPGLGDALVGGREQPEEITVQITRGHLRIIERGGRVVAVLGDAQALELARLTWRVHWALGNGQEPQDLEWSHDGRRFWLLQARPVTGLPPATHPDLAGQPVYWSSANVKEVVPGIPSTLTWSVLQPALWDILYAVQLAVGYRLPPGLEMIRRHAGRLYFDLSALQYIFYDSFGGSPAVLNELLGGHQPLIDVPPGSPFLSRRGLHRLRNSVRLARIMLTVPGRLFALLPSAATIIRRAKALDLARQTPAQLLAWLYRVGDRSRPIGRLAQLINASAGGWYTALQTVLRWQVGERGPVLAAGLMAGSDQVTTAAHGYRLFDLAALARRDHAALAYFERTPFDPHGWRRLPADSLFRRAFEHFLAEFGHRTVYEIEVANPRWNEDPTFLLEQVRFLLAHPPPYHPRDAARRTRAAAEAELNGRMRLLRPVVRWLANRMRRGTALRERAKSLMVALWEPMRYLILEAGRRLTAAGALEQVEDVFHLSYPDLESYLRGEWDGRVLALWSPIAANSSPPGRARRRRMFSSRIRQGSPLIVRGMRPTLSRHLMPIRGRDLPFPPAVPWGRRVFSGIPPKRRAFGPAMC